ncbi:MAG: hypothetical protein ACLTYN_07100 [Dysosmobacter welbionis]
MLDGNSYYFLRLEGQDTFYAVNARRTPGGDPECRGSVTIAYAGRAAAFSPAPPSPGPERPRDLHRRRRQLMPPPKRASRQKMLPLPISPPENAVSQQARRRLRQGLSFGASFL